MNLPNPFRTLARWIAGRRPGRTIRKPTRIRLSVTVLEGLVMPSGAMPFQVDQQGGWQFFTAAASDAQGNSVIVYDSLGDDGTTYQKVYARRVDPHGNVVGDPFRVNTDESSDMVPGGIAMAPDGRFVIVWFGIGPGADGNDIYARRYNADATPADAVEFRVNQFTSGLQWYPTVAMDADGNFLVAFTDQGRDASQLPQAYARLFSWDLQSTSPDFPLEAVWAGNQWSQTPRVSMAAGTIVGAYNVYTTYQDPSEWAAYLQRFSYAVNATTGAFDVTPVGGAIMPYLDGTGSQGVTPVVAPDGSFTAVIDTAPSGVGSEDIFFRRFAADATPIDAALVPVTTAAGDQWTQRAGLDGSGNLYVSWREGSNYWNLYAREFNADATPLTDAIRITPQTELAHPWSVGSIAVAPDGSLTAVWTTYRPNADGFGVEARHYDPIVASTTETDTLSDASTGEQVSVTSTATTFADHVLWEYRVTNVNYTGGGQNHDATDVGLFSVLHGITGNQDLSNSLGWVNDDSGLEGPGIGWVTAPDGSLLAPGQSAYYTFTTPLAAIGHVEAQASEADYASFADGLVLGPVTADSGVSISATDAAATAWDSDSGSGVTPGTYEVTRTGDVTDPLTITYNVGGDAVAGVDYQSLSGTITIPAGKQSATIVVTPLVTNTNATHLVTVDLVPMSGISLLADMPIQEVYFAPDGGLNSLPAMSVDAIDPTAYEGQSTGDIRITRPGDGTALTVNVSLSGGLGQHYTATVNGAAFTGGQLTIPTGQSSIDVLITPVEDSDTDNNVATLTVSSGSGYRLGATSQASVTIMDDGVGSDTQTLPVVSIEAIDPNATVVTDPGMFRFSIGQPLPYDLTVRFWMGGIPVVSLWGMSNPGSELPGQAVVGLPQSGEFVGSSNFNSLGGVVIPAGADHVDLLIMASVNISSYGPYSVTFELTNDRWSDGGNGPPYSIGDANTATVTVTNNTNYGETPYVVPVPGNNILDQEQLGWGVGPGLYVIGSPSFGAAVDLISSGPISNANTGRVNVSYSGTATASDYSPGPGTTVAQIHNSNFGGSTPITPLPDAGDNGPKTVTATVLGGSGYTVGPWDSVTVTILDGDGDGPPPAPQYVAVEAIDPTASQPTQSSGLFRFTRTGDTSGPLTVQYEVGHPPDGTTDGGFGKDGTPDAQPGTDYVPIDDGSGIGTVTFAAGQTSVLVPVSPVAYASGTQPDNGRLDVTVGLLPDATEAVYGLNPATQSATVTIMFDPMLIHTQAALEAQNHTVIGMAFTADEYDASANPIFSVHIIDQPTHGILRRRFDGGYDYVGDISYTGLDSFSYQLSDGPILSGVVHVAVLAYGDFVAPGEFEDFPLMGSALYIGNNGQPDPNSVNQAATLIDGQTGAVLQRGIADCWFVAAAAGLAMQRPTDLMLIGDMNNGSYIVKFPHNQTATVSLAGDTNTYSSSNGDWLKILEKGYGQYCWNQALLNFLTTPYACINRGGPITEGIDILTGHSTDPDSFWITRDSVTRQKLTTALANHKVVLAGTPGGSEANPTKDGIVLGHMYTVVAYDAATDRVRLRNPWGFNPTYPVVGDGAFYRGKGVEPSNDGYFWMPLTSLTKMFSEMCYEE